MQLLRELFGGQPEEEQRKADVLAETRARVRQHPEDAGAHFALGSVYYVRGRLDDAVKELERAVELDPDTDDANYMLGLAYAKLERYESAGRAFQAAGEHTDNSMLQDYVQQKLKELKSHPIHEPG